MNIINKNLVWNRWNTIMEREIFIGVTRGGWGFPHGSSASGAGK